MTDELKPTRDEINALRLKAFSTNNRDDIMAYFKACSGWFQDEDYRVLARAERDDALIRAALEAGAERGWQVGCPLNTAKAIRALADDPEAVALIIKAAEGRG